MLSVQNERLHNLRHNFKRANDEPPFNHRRNIDKKPQDKHQSKKCRGKIMQEPNRMYSQLSNVDMISFSSAALSF